MMRPAKIVCARRRFILLSNPLGILKCIEIKPRRLNRLRVGLALLALVDACIQRQHIHQFTKLAPEPSALQLSLRSDETLLAILKLERHL